MQLFCETGGEAYFFASISEAINKSLPVSGRPVLHLQQIQFLAESVYGH